MDRTLDTPDERVERLIAEIVHLTGEDKGTALCRALEERLERLRDTGQRLLGVGPETRR